jgi:hypothetical protein
VNAKLREKLIDEILKNGDYLEDRINEKESKVCQLPPTKVRGIPWLEDLEKKFLFFLIVVVFAGLLLLTLF